MSALVDENIGTTPVRAGFGFDEPALTRWMEQHVEGFAGPLTVEQFKGGQSNPTYRIDTPGASYVLRRQPFGKLLPSAHAVDREYTAMTGLYPTGFPVPRTYGLCEDVDVIGSKFFVMSMADGRSLWNGALPGLSPDERRAHYNALIDTMAELHLNKPDEIGMGDFGKPNDYCARQITRWTKQYKLSETEHMPEMERLIEWLPQTIPPQHGSSVVHGDYRLDNVIFHKTEPRIIAVLDWEMATVGPREVDLAWMIFLHTFFHDMAVTFGLPGMTDFLQRDSVIAEYEALTGHKVQNLEWFEGYAALRFAIVSIRTSKRGIAYGTMEEPTDPDDLIMFRGLLEKMLAGTYWS